MNNKNIIIIPYAYIPNYNSSNNLDKQDDTFLIYMKNCCVSLLSARFYNDENKTDVALVTNVSIPEEYRRILSDNNISVINIPFDCFVFPNNYEWSLCFFKLCALHNILKKYDYSNYCYLDSDVYIQSSFEDIWKECKEHILMYDICHGLQTKDYNEILSEFKLFNKGMITHYGGEFFAANRQNAFLFLQECLNVYNTMVKNKITTTHGDEFIVSLAIDNLDKQIVKNAGAYIYRFWTGRFRLVSTNYLNNPVTILHVPREKRYGMIRIFNYYLRKGRLPSLNKVHKLLHISCQDWKVRLGMLFKLK